MTTIDDMASDMEEKERAMALTRRKQVLPYTGYCHNCGEACNGVYCGLECREDGEKRRRFRNGE